jgi:hypothetical protein
MRSYRDFNYDNLRLAGAAEWHPLGQRLTANLMGGINATRDSVDYQYLALARNTDHRLWIYEYTNIRRYWNESSRPIPDLSLQPVRFVDPINGIDTAITPRWLPDIGRTDTEAINHARFKFALASANLRLFKDRLILLGALRYDRYFIGTRQQVRPGDYPVNWDGDTVVFKPDAPSDFSNLTYRLRDNAGVAYGPVLEAANRPRFGLSRDPLYLNERFKDDYNAPAQVGARMTKNYGTVVHLTDWLSPFFNYAETFNPNTFTTRIDGSLLAPTVADGIDYGLRLELFSRRVDLRMTRYTNKEINGAIPSGGPEFFNILYDSNVVGDFTNFGRNKRGVSPIPGQYRDTRTRISEGTEFELTLNPSKALRLTANLSFPKVYEFNLNPDIRAYIAANGELFRQIAGDAGVLIDPKTNTATVDLSIPEGQRSPDANSAAIAYNDIYNFLKGSVIDKRLNQDQPILNLFGDYTIQEGFLRNLRMGIGVRYRGKQIIGNKGNDTIVDPSNPAKAIDDPSVDAYTPLYSPAPYTIYTLTMGYNWRFHGGRSVALNLVIDNLINDRGPIYSSTAQSASLMRPRDGDYTSPARVTVPRYYALKQPRSFDLSVTIAL